VQGIDVWVNTPRRPWEACGTSGMKVLVNGGLNCSALDGWWDEAYEPEVGWAIGDEHGGAVAEVDARDAERLYRILESNIVPEFYTRDTAGLPRAWLRRIRKSISTLTAAFSSTRMMQDYIEQVYIPQAKAVRERWKEKYTKARELNAWARHVHRRWPTLHIGNPTFTRVNKAWHVFVPVYVGEVPPSSVRVELFADTNKLHPPEVIVLHQEQAIPGSNNGCIYAGAVETSRPANDYTVRVVPYHPDAILPAELPLITWQR
jgi:glycogen phosphorylase